MSDDWRLARIEHLTGQAGLVGKLLWVCKLHRCHLYPTTVQPVYATNLVQDSDTTLPGFRNCGQIAHVPQKSLIVFDQETHLYLDFMRWSDWAKMTNEEFKQLYKITKISDIVIGH